MTTEDRIKRLENRLKKLERMKKTVDLIVDRAIPLINDISDKLAKLYTRVKTLEGNQKDR